VEFEFFHSIRFICLISYLDVDSRPTEQHARFVCIFQTFSANF